MKKIILLIVAINLFLSLGINVNAANILGFHSVKNGKIRYNGYSKYNNLIYKGVKTWNDYGNIDIYLYYGSGGDIEYMDGYNSGASWSGVYAPKTFLETGVKPSGYDSGYIIFNKYYVDGHSSLGNFDDDEKQRLATHEFGHSLGIAHTNKANNIMKPGKSDQIQLGSQDKSDYDYLWGN